MIRSKNHKAGFTLIEALLAMMIVGFALNPLFGILSAIMRRVSISSRTYEYLLLCKNFMYEARQKQEPEAQTFKLEKVDPDSSAELTYSLSQGVDQKSPFASLVGLHKEEVIVSWTELGAKKSTQLVTFIYKKPEQKKS